MEKPKILGIIPARGGSKSIPRKNIKPLAGKPLIYYTIREAKKSKYLSRIIISTEDKEIAKISKKYGAEVPFLRPKRLAGDRVRIIYVVLDLVKKLKKQGENYDYIVLLQPTSPLRKTEDIDKAIEKLLKKKAKSLVSVVRIYDSHPIRVKKIKKGYVYPYCLPEPEGAPKQVLPPAYLRNGAVYIVETNLLLKKRTFFDKKILSYEMPEERSVNIDSKLDFLLAEILMKKKNA